MCVRSKSQILRVKNVKKQNLTHPKAAKLATLHNGLTHFLAFRDNQEKLNYRAIRQKDLIIVVLLTCIGTKIKRCTKIKGQGHSQ